MTKTSRNSLTKKLIIILMALLLCAVIASQFVYAPAFIATPNGSSAYADGMNGVKVSYTDAENGLVSDEYSLSDPGVTSSAANEPTPAPDKQVDVIISLDGTPMMQFATAKNQTVAQALATSGGRKNLDDLINIREKALNGISKYIIEKRFEYTTVLNAFSATVRFGDISAIESNKYVENVILSNKYLAPEAVTENYVDVYETGIFDSTGVGYDGTGTVVAVVDTGTDIYHEVFDMELDANTLAITKDDVAAVAASLTATSMSSAEGDSIDEDDLYIKSKLPFAYDYADSDTNVYPRNSHGTHVAGIIAGKSDVITGVAPKAQIATFKVFSDYKEGAGSEGIMAALNDAVTLGVDAINMSLGSSCGFSREVDEKLINDVYDSINEAGICLVVAASNDASSAQNSTWGNTNLATNPDSGTVGSPGSYNAALSVGSVSGVKTKYFVAEGHEIYFAESRLLGKTKPNDFVGGLLGDKTEGVFEYVVIPGVGLPVNYQDYDVNGKIAVVQRGNTSFEEKVRVAAGRGAIGVIVYNNVSGTITMSVGTKELIPSCFVTMDFAEPIVAAGKGKITLSTSYLAGPFMSDFSSWGALPNLILAPDITAHGGEIYSSVAGKDQYDRLSGTSMACPNLAGALILVRQSVKENYPEYATTQIRDVSYSRMMSTATIVKNEQGNPYSPRKQGAGIADISNSINTKAYLTVNGSNKPKLSLGDDPERSGEYEMKFNLVNTTGNAVSYNLGQFVMTESMSSDDRTVAEKAYMFDDTINTYAVRQTKGTAKLSGKTVSLSGYGEAEITVTVKLSDKDKKYIDEYFRNGMYVEGYILLDSNNSDGIDLNIPFLAFYGDWSDAPMLDLSAYEVGESEADDSVLAEDKLKADVYGTLPYAGFYSETGTDNLGYWGMGAFAFIPASGYATPPTQEKYAALTTNPNGNYLLYMINAGLLRCAKRVDMEIRNSATGELIWSGVDYNSRKSHASGEQVGGMVMVELDIRELDLPNNSKYTFEMTCYLDWTGDNSYINSKDDPDLDKFTYGNKNTFSFEFTVDNEAPEVSNVAVRKIKNSNNNYEYYLDLTFYDNHYMQGFSAYTFEGKDENGSLIGTTSLTDGVVPVLSELNTDTTCSINISGYWNLIQQNGGKLYVTMYDYAKNDASIEIELTEENYKKTDLQISKTRTARDEYTVAPNGQIDLTDYITIRASVFDNVSEDEKTYLENYWMRDLVWVSSDGSVVEVSQQGLVTGLKHGDSVITVHTPNVDVFDENDELHCLKFTIHVSGTPLDEIKLSGIELSATSLTLERGETYTITATAKPYNYTGDLKIKWSTTSSNVVSINVSADGRSVELYAVKSGSATVRASVDGSYVSGYCSVGVQQEFNVYNNIYLRSYTGRGGDWVNENGETEHNVVEIPDDLGVSYIYPLAFINNKYIKKVIIPEGVTTIMRGAFLGCEALEEVVLPESLETLEEYVFGDCDNLKRINLGHVKTIGDSAFWGCQLLESVDLSNCTYIDKYAFVFCRSLKELDLSRVGAVGGGAFFNCTGLETLVIPEHTSLEYDTKYLELKDESKRSDLGGAFGACTGLKTLIIKSNKIGDRAFRDCISLETVIFENDVEVIGEFAFLNCENLKNVTFYGSAYKIESYAFLNCKSLETLKLPKGLTILGENVFLGCDSLASVSVSSGALLQDIHMYSLGSLDVEEFVVEDGNKYLSAVDGVLYDRAQKKLLAYPGGKSGSSFVIPDSVRTVGSSAFSGTRTLGTIDLNKVEYIEDYAFANIMRTEPRLDSNGKPMTDDEGNVLVNVYYTDFKGGNNIKYIGDHAFFRAVVTTLPIYGNVTYIGDYAFNGVSVSSDSVSLNMLPNIKHIGDYAFAGQTVKTTDGKETTFHMNITSVTFNKSTLKSVGKGAFYNNPLLASVDLGSLEEISDNMFENCSSLKNIVIPDTVKSLGANAFTNCTRLAGVTLSASITDIPTGAFANTALTALTLPDSVRSVGNYAFADTRISSLDLNNVETIGKYAFRAAPLSTVASDKVTRIGIGAFTNCDKLTSVNMPNVEELGESAFENCSLLTGAVLTKLKYIGDKAFKGCSQLGNIVLDNAVKVGNQAFYGVTGITEIHLPKAETIGSEAFFGTAVTTVSISETVTKVADKAFYGMEKLISVTVSDANKTFKSLDGVLYSVNSQDMYTMLCYPAGKTDKTVYTVFERTIKLGAYSFSSNKTLTEVTLPAYLQIIGASAMSGMTGLEKLIINAVSAPTLESIAYLTYEDDPVEDGSEGSDESSGTDKVDGNDNNYDDSDKEEELERDKIKYVNVYDNFSFEMKDADKDQKLKIVIPYNATGYNNRIWKAYVGKCIQKSKDIHITLGTLEFIDDIKAAAKDPDITQAEIAQLKRIYNMISSVQQRFVTGNYEYQVTDNGGNVVSRIDAEYYNNLLGGVNYKQILDGLTGRAASAVSGAAVSEISGTISAETANYSAAVAAAVVVVSAVVFAAAAILKRRSAK